ncbi:phage-related protein [Methanobrevibacter ruminantium M1]|uniref:Phage-related protein n=1 Tax=Methanobrevibacter ruminantium (strain ATCC 35063 / DSM 1093 / JCM 13430 / OCM 146 / M1) TaxID=634498 RepID=D3E4L3_METRM|nr:phage minor head protein [Methanobrevibacter ruminantium]ADC45909.1 phage-related protein [Methanobrevibacter ruminantium M1]
MTEEINEKINTQLEEEIKGFGTRVVEIFKNTKSTKKENEDPEDDNTKKSQEFITVAEFNEFKIETLEFVTEMNNKANNLIKASEKFGDPEDDYAEIVNKVDTLLQGLHNELLGKEITIEDRLDKRNTLVRMSLKVHQSKRILKLLDKQSQMRSAEENNLKKDLSKWFHKLERRIQNLIDIYYENELFFLHINKVTTIVEDMKPEYNTILLKHGLTVFYNARETATTLYTIQQKKVSSKTGLYEPKIMRETDVGLFRTNPEIEDSLRYSTFQASNSTLIRVSKNITNNLADSYHKGLGIEDVGHKITEEFTGLKGWQAKRIARTEINSASNVGTFSVYDELGVEYHMWWTGNDARVRDSHKPLHSHIVAVGNTFSNGLLHPGDKSGPINEWINCRCTSVPYIIPLGMMAPPGVKEFTEDQLIPIPDYDSSKDRGKIINSSSNSFNNVLKVPNNKLKKEGHNFRKKELEELLELKIREKSLKQPIIKSDNTPLVELEHPILKRELDNFDKFLEDKDIEYFQMYTFDGREASKLYIGKMHEVDVPNEEIIEAVRKGGKISVHNHPTNFDNMHSISDIYTQIETGIELNIVKSYTKKYIVVAEDLSSKERKYLLNQLEKIEKKYNEFIEKEKKPYLRGLDKIDLTVAEREYAEEIIHQYVVINNYDKYEKVMSYFFKANPSIDLYVYDI